MFLVFFTIDKLSVSYNNMEFWTLAYRIPYSIDSGTLTILESEDSCITTSKDSRRHFNRFFHATSSC